MEAHETIRRMAGPQLYLMTNENNNSVGTSGVVTNICILTAWPVPLMTSVGAPAPQMIARPSKQAGIQMRADDDTVRETELSSHGHGRRRIITAAKPRYLTLPDLTLGMAGSRNAPASSSHHTASSRDPRSPPWSSRERRRASPSQRAVPGETSLEEL